MSVSQIKEDLNNRWRDDAVLEVCLRIVDYIAALPPPERRMLTFRAICRAARKKRVDDELLSALNVLVGSTVAALDARAMLVDEDQTEYELDPQTFAKAQATGELIHPETGEPVPEFATRIVPFFVPSERFES